MRVVHGNILTTFQRGILAHGVNCQGKFNAGLAKQIRQAYPEAYHDYMKAWEAGQLRLGAVIYSRVSPELTIASCVTQQYYGRDPDVVYVDYAAVVKTLSEVAQCALSVHHDCPVALPRIGAGLANGDAARLQRIYEGSFLGLSDVTIYEYTAD